MCYNPGMQSRYLKPHTVWNSCNCLCSHRMRSTRSQNWRQWNPGWWTGGIARQRSNPQPYPMRMTPPPPSPGSRSHHQRRWARPENILSSNTFCCTEKCYWLLHTRRLFIQFRLLIIRTRTRSEGDIKMSQETTEGRSNMFVHCSFNFLRSVRARRFVCLSFDESEWHWSPVNVE